MLENNAIGEKDLFKSIIAKDNLDKEKEKEILNNIKIFLKMIPKNIFKNEYYAIYEAIKAARKYNIILNSLHFNQILLNNIEVLINNKNIDIEDFATDTKDKLLVKEEFIQLCMSTYKELSEIEEDSSRFPLNIELYIKSWADQQYMELQAECYQIASEGKYIGKKFIQGMEEAHKHYNKKAAEILEIANTKDKELESILVSPEGYQRYKEMEQEDVTSGVIAVTGIGEIDEEIGGFEKGSLLVIQGPTGSGKSRLATNIAHEAILRGHNGVVFALEGSPRRAVSMFIARHLAVKFNCDHIDDDSIFKKTYSSEYSELVESAEYDLFYNENYGKFKIVPSPVYDEDIEGILEDIWDNVFNFDWVVLDYSSLVRSRSKDTVTAMLTDLMPKLETMCQSFKGEGFFLIIPHQLKVETINALMKGEDRTLTGSADSSSVMKSAHNALTIYTDDELKLKDMCKIICTKTRHTQGLPAKEYYAKLGVCVFGDLPL